MRTRAPNASNAPSTSRATQRGEIESDADPRPRQAFEDVIGALLCDASLVSLARPYFETCPFEDLRSILLAIGALHADETARIDAASVMDALGENSARNRVVPIQEHASRAESPLALLNGQLKYLKDQKLRLEADALKLAAREQDEIAAQDSETSAAANAQAEELYRRLSEKNAEIRELQATDSIENPRPQLNPTHG